MRGKNLHLLSYSSARQRMLYSPTLAQTSYSSDLDDNSKRNDNNIKCCNMSLGEFRPELSGFLRKGAKTSQKKAKRAKLSFN